jgi:ribosomal protein S18 acetylase RimI-like enzyme
MTASTGSHEPHAEHDHGHGTSRGPLVDASVRVARDSDAPAVGLVQAAVWREAYAGVLDADVIAAFDAQQFARIWRDSLANPPAGVYRLLVACAGDQVVGFAAIGPSQDPDAGQATGEVLALGVHPEARRQGHGSRLLNACVDTLRDAGAEAVHAWVLLEDAVSRVFLEGAGLLPDGAFRDRVVSPSGGTAREVRLGADLTSEQPAADRP